MSLVAAVASAMPARAEQPAFPPFSFADVDFEPECRPNHALERLLTVLHGRAGRPAEDEDIAPGQPLHDAVSGATFHRLILDEPADWHGLHLKGIDLYLGIERGPSNYTLIFDDPVGDVRDVWNARGWNLPALGERRDIEGLEGYAAITIDGVDDRGAAVTCIRD